MPLCFCTLCGTQVDPDVEMICPSCGLQPLRGENVECLPDPAPPPVDLDLRQTDSTNIRANSPWNTAAAP